MSPPFAPQWGVAPGEILQEELEEREMTQVELARLMGRSAKHVNQLIKGRVGLTPTTALELEAALGIDALVWLRLEATWRLYLARERASET